MYYNETSILLEKAFGTKEFKPFFSFGGSYHFNLYTDYSVREVKETSAEVYTSIRDIEFNIPDTFYGLIARIGLNKAMGEANLRMLATYCYYFGIEKVHDSFINPVSLSIEWCF